MFTITYFGYAAVLVNFEKHIIFDPGIVEKVPLIDPDSVQVSYVLVSHTPIEHFGNAVTFANDKGSILVGNKSVYDYARKEGVYGYAVVALDTSKPLKIGANIQITGYDLPRSGFLAPKNTAFLVTSKQGSVLHLGHAKEIGPLADTKPDILCISVAGKKQGTFSLESAVEATIAIHPRYALPLSGTPIQNTEFFNKIKQETTEIIPIAIDTGQSFTLV